MEKFTGYNEPSDEEISFEAVESVARKTRNSIPRLTIKIHTKNVLLKGYLDKKQPKAFVFGKWKPRYWVLTKEKFKYYENQESLQHLGVIDFNKVEASVYPVVDTPKCFKITLNGSTKQLFFKAKDEDEWLKWVSKLDEIIQASKGKHLSLKITDPKFWKDEYISMHEFRQHADNCDLLLFKSKTFTTKLHRAFTKSNYDHVGMLVLWETDDNANTIFLLEAVADEGVRLVEFLPNLDAYFDVYSKIAYRPLQSMERDEVLLTNLDSYLEEVLGKSYEVSFTKFFRKSISLKSHEGKYIEDVNRKFQCAELVAKMYKVLGILSESIHSNKYLPAHFTNKRSIQLEKGTFGPEWTMYKSD